MAVWNTSKPVAYQTWSVIEERNNRWYNRNNAPSPDNKGSYRSYGRMKIEVWKSYRITVKYNCFHKEHQHQHPHCNKDIKTNQSIMHSVHTYIHTCMHACMHAYIHAYKYKRRKLLLLTRVSRSRRSSDDRLERETRVTSNNFLLLYLYFALHISASSTPRLSEAILCLVNSFTYMHTYILLPQPHIVNVWMQQTKQYQIYIHINSYKNNCKVTLQIKFWALLTRMQSKKGI